MTRPITSSKVVLLEDRRGGAASGGAPVRRYRLARLRFDAPAVESSGRFEYLKRSHD